MKTVVVCVIVCFVVIFVANNLTELNRLPIGTHDRVVIVGNGPSVGSHDWGKLIDSFDVVIRFNAAPIIPSKTGTKTTIHVITGGSLNDFKEGATPVIAYNHPLQRLLRPKMCVRCMPLFSNNDVHVNPTSGLLTILHVLKYHPNNQVFIVGFDGMQTKDFSKEHYFESNNASRTWTDRLLTPIGMNHHSNESTTFQKLLASHPNLQELASLKGQPGERPDHPSTPAWVWSP